MQRRVKRPGAFMLTILLSLLISTTVYAEIKVGWLVDISADKGKVTIDEALEYPKKEYVVYSINEDAKWHICTAKACILKEGAEGYSTFMEVVKKEAYGRPLRSFRVLLDTVEKKVRSIEIQVSTKMH